MKISINLNYKGSSKILKRLCQCVNYLSQYADGDMRKEIYDTNEDGIVDNAALVNEHFVEKDVPADALFTDTVYDDTSLRGQVTANANNITLLMDTLFKTNDRYYLVDSDGYRILDSDGNPIVTAHYTSKLIEIQAQIEALQAVAAQFESLGLAVTDGQIEQTITEGE